MKSVLYIITIGLLTIGCSKPVPRYDNIFRAIQAGDLDDVRIHLKLDTPIEALSPTGNTPLREAVLTYHSGIAQFLLGRGADVQICTPIEKTLMHDAALLNDSTMTGILLRAGLSADAHCGERGNALCGYPDSISTSMMEWLLIAGADADGKGNYYLPPLHMSAWRNRPDQFELLLQFGADPGTLDNYVHCPADSFAKWRCPDCSVPLGHPANLPTRPAVMDEEINASQKVEEINLQIDRGDITLEEADRKLQLLITKSKRQKAYLETNEHKVEIRLDVIRDFKP